VSTTVIDALLVTLGLDVSDLVKNANVANQALKKIADEAAAAAKSIDEVEQKLSAAQVTRAKELEARSQQIAQSIVRIRDQALRLMPLFMVNTVLQEFIDSTIAAGANTGTLADNLRTATEKMSAHQQATERAGGSAETMNAQTKEGNTLLSVRANIMDKIQKLGDFFWPKEKEAKKPEDKAGGVAASPEPGPGKKEELKTAPDRNEAKKPKGKAGGVAGSRKIQAATKQEAEDMEASKQVVQQLMDLGWEQEQAIGIAANFLHESHFKPQARGDGGKAYGLAQWHPDRQAHFKKKYGKDIHQATRKEQVKFADYELRYGEERRAGNKLKDAKTAEEAGAIVSKYFERPKKRREEAVARAATASKIETWIGKVDGKGTDNAKATASMPTGLKVASLASNGGNSTSTTDVKIAQINVHTQATDPVGIAKGIGDAMTKYAFVTQENRGLT
jgi:hypothetical protein